MKLRVNQVEKELPAGCSLQDLLLALDFKPPYAVARNLDFVPKSKYATTPLQEGDQIEVISPITGG
jgi:sulfur carrier protein